VAKKLGLIIKWKGKGINEKAINLSNNKTIIDIDKKFFRPTEVDFLRGDFSKAKRLLKWKPAYNTDDLIEDMISSELEDF
jgi:GDPmannose 4,6-dehydratase